MQTPSAQQLCGDGKTAMWSPEPNPGRSWASPRGLLHMFSVRESHPPGGFLLGGSILCMLRAWTGNMFTKGWLQSLLKKKSEPLSPRPPLLWKTSLWSQVGTLVGFPSVQCLLPASLPWPFDEVTPDNHGFLLVPGLEGTMQGIPVA